jgi:hypothetical protein
MRKGKFQVTFAMTCVRSLEEFEFGDATTSRDTKPSERSGYGLSVREVPARLELLSNTITVQPSWYDQAISTTCRALADVLAAKFFGTDLRAIDEAWCVYLAVCARLPRINLAVAFLGEPGNPHGRELRLHDPVPLPPEAHCQRCHTVVTDSRASREPQARVPLPKFNDKNMLLMQMNWRPVLICTHACLDKLHQQNKEISECRKTLNKITSPRIPIPAVPAIARSRKKV